MLRSVAEVKSRLMESPFMSVPVPSIPAQTLWFSSPLKRIQLYLCTSKQHQWARPWLTLSWA